METHKDSSIYPDATELWTYFTSVMDWVWEVFEGNDETNYESSMKSVEWGLLYNKYHKQMDALSHKEYEQKKEDIRKRVQELSCFEVDKAGKYYYAIDEVLNGSDNADLSVLHIRSFPQKIKEKVYAKQHHICPACGCIFHDIKDMEADHIVPWSKGGFTDEDNCQMLCADCNNKKSANEHFGQAYSVYEVMSMSQEDIDKLPIGTLKIKSKE